MTVFDKSLQNHAPPGPITCSSRFRLSPQKLVRVNLESKRVLILKFSLFILLYFPGLFVPGFLGPEWRVRRGQMTVEAAEEKLKMISSIWYFVFFKDTRNILGQLIDCGATLQMLGLIWVDGFERNKSLTSINYWNILHVTSLIFLLLIYLF